MPFAVLGYFHGGCWRARAQLRQYPPFACSAFIDALSLTPHVSAKKDASGGFGAGPGLVAVRVWAPWARPGRGGRAVPPAVGRHLTSWKRRAVALSGHDCAHCSPIADPRRFWRAPRRVWPLGCNSQLNQLKRSNS